MIAAPAFRETTIRSVRTKVLAIGSGRCGSRTCVSARRRSAPDSRGGAYLLGLKGLVVIAHGNSSRRAIQNAILLGTRGVEKDVVGRLAARLPERTPTGAVREP